MSGFVLIDTDNLIEYVYSSDNSVIIKELKIVNNTNEVWTDVKITVSSKPGFIKQKNFSSEFINPGEEKVIRNYIAKTDNALLKSVKGETPAEIICTLEVDGVVIGETIKKVNFAAFNPKNENSMSEISRIDIWKKKLLNLSPANPLLNCRINSSNLPVLCPNPARLEDFLSDGKKISLVSAEKVLNISLPEGTLSLKGCDSEIIKKADQALNQKQIMVNVPENKLKSVVLALYGKTKNIIEEGGVNTLYLAIGFLNWKKKKDNSGKIYHAPLILCPVSLERVTVKDGIKLYASEDELRFNTTLSEMLKQDFEISVPELEGELPTDESGVDVLKVWDIVRSAVKDVEGFDVVEETVLGHFSFNKYLMWKDLNAGSEDLSEHPVIGSLINSEKKIKDDIPFINPNELDKLYKAGYFYTPLPADSSQLAVIASADKGKSFVMQGPPGTGKSQTIANLIAHFIAKKKRVLFISEKMAALQVVYKRLENIGLGNFCLELHSNKANKKEILNKLGTAWEKSDTNYRDYRSRKAEEVNELVSQLSGLSTCLHTPCNNGFTPYMALSFNIRNSKYANELRLDWQKSDCHTEEDYANLKNIVHKLQVQSSACSSMFNSNMFSGITKTNWSPEWQQKLFETCDLLIKSLNLAVNSAKELIDILKIDINVEEVKMLDCFNKLTKILLGSMLPFASLIFDEKSDEIFSNLENSLKCINLFNSEKSKLNSKNPELVRKSVNGKDILMRWEKTKKESFIQAIIDRYKITSELKKAGMNSNLKLPADALTLKTIQDYSEKINSFTPVMQIFPFWKAEETEVEKLSKLLSLKESVEQIIAEYSSAPETEVTLTTKIKTMFSGATEVVKNKDVKEKIKTFRQHYKNFESFCDSFKKLCDPKNLSYNVVIGSNLNTLNSYSNELKKTPGNIKEWCIWNKIKEEAAELSLQPLTEALEHNAIEPDKTEKVFEAAYFSWQSKALVSEKQALRDFSSSQYLDTVKRYDLYDEELKALSIRYICSTLAEGIPSKDAGNLTKEWMFLQREMKKRTRIKPVRQLLANATEAIQRLKPCFMMSPLSVAQYLPDVKDMFDVVIVDESSQITVWDAIGALSRAKQIIVAGDPKQMPPSNFFGRLLESNEEDYGPEEDMDSILDELIAVGLPSASLNWHYRSKCESLIDFSNKKYYDASLITFPSSHTAQKSVLFRHVQNGCYEKGLRVNKAEALMVVRECVARLTHSNPKIRNRSIGIVTFNSSQQKLIEDMLERELEFHPEMEFAFSSDNPNALFVKNLETVQGDERDVILFSVTYGPDKFGKISMNFGPLNSSGGERRLNVAFTRAKYEMVIFSSLLAENIDLSRTNSRAVADLKDFLHYAHSGESSYDNISVALDEKNFPFEYEIAEKLAAKGWKVQTKVGKSSFKIDVAVVNPDNPKEFLAGIITDGKTYNKAATVSDREKSIPSVLKSLGWNIINIRIIDWWNDPEGSLKKLHVELYRLYEHSKTLRQQKVEK